MARFLCVLCVLLTFATSAIAQISTVSDPEATSLAAKSNLALTGGAAISDVTVSGTATLMAGSDVQSGNATFKAKGTGESRVDLNLGGVTRIDIHDWTNGLPAGLRGQKDDPLKASAQHNVWSDPSWFFPALSSLSSSQDPSIVFFYFGLETRAGMSVQHLRCYRIVDRSAQPLSQMEFYLDAATLLPHELTFNIHPDDNVGVDIPVVIVYSDYQQSNGLMIPMRIQRYLQGSLEFDVNVASAAINTGLSDTEFSAQ